MSGEFLAAFRSSPGTCRVTETIVRRTGRRSGISLLLLLLTAIPIRADFDEALAYYKAGNWLEAAARFQTLVDESPGYDYGHYMLGHCLLRMGRPGEAERSFERAAGLRGDKPEYYHGLALAYRAQKRHVPALAALARGAPFVRDGRTAWSYLVLRAWTLATLRRWADAASDLEKAILIRSDPVLFDMLGRANQSLARYDRAATAFAMALRAAPEDPDLLRRFADVLLRLAASTSDPGRKRAAYAQAIAATERLRRLRPGDPDVSELYGRAALGARHLEAAEAALRDALAARPGFCPAKINLARALQALGRLEDAEAQLVEAASCAPTSAEVHEELGGVYFRQRRFERALDAFRRANELMPSPSARAGMEAARVRLQVRRDGADPAR